MTFKQNLTELKSYIKQAPVENRSKIEDVIKLYEEKKIPNIRTALNATILLSSKNKNTIKSGRPEREYQKLMTKYVEAEPMTGRLTRELEHELKLGDHEKVNTYIQIVIKSEKTDANGVETRSFKNIFALYRDKLLSGD
jgi:septation ring formation regulator EzrA